MMTDCGTYLRFWDVDGEPWNVTADCVHSIDAQVGQYLDTGRDSLIHLTTLAGEDYVTRASRILEWVVTTPEGRFRALEFVRASEVEMASAREALGLPPEQPREREDWEKE